MESVADAGVAIDFIPRRAQWSQAAREDIARRCNNVECLKGLTYRCGRFDWTDKRGMFKVDYLPFASPYSTQTFDSLKLIPQDVTWRMVVEMLKVLECCSHTILATKGFREIGGELTIGRKVELYVLSYAQFLRLPTRIEDDYADVEDCCCEVIGTV